LLHVEHLAVEEDHFVHLAKCASEDQHNWNWLKLSQSSRKYVKEHLHFNLSKFSDVRTWKKHLGGMQRMYFTLGSIGFLKPFVRNYGIQWKTWCSHVKYLRLLAKLHPSSEETSRMSSMVRTTLAQMMNCYGFEIVKPLQHIATHYSEQFELHGSLRDTSTFVYEALILVVKRLRKNTNGRHWAFSNLQRLWLARWLSWLLNSSEELPK